MDRFLFLAAIAVALAIVAACGDGSTDHADECEQGGLGGPGCSPTPTVDDSCSPAGYFGYAPVVTFGDVSLFIEIADDATERAKGLSNRDCLGDDWGMLFVYPADSQNTFHMRNVFVPLSIAWLRADGTIIAIEDMAPQTNGPYSSPAPFRYAIEANQGWFSDHGIAVGDVATIPANLSAS